LLNLAVGLSFPSLLSYSGIGGAFLLYAVFNFAGGLVCVLFMVETKSHTLGAIRRMLTPVNSQARIEFDSRA
jgi:hypothetical protein